jgi:hypothetical protein
LKPQPALELLKRQALTMATVEEQEHMHREDLFQTLGAGFYPSEMIPSAFAELLVHRFCILWEKQ